MTVRPPKTREQLFAEAGNLCSYCGLRPPTHLDHIRPRSRGGSDAVVNLTAVCDECGHTKRDLTIYEWVTARYPAGRLAPTMAELDAARAELDDSPERVPTAVWDLLARAEDLAAALESGRVVEASRIIRALRAFSRAARDRPGNLPPQPACPTAERRGTRTVAKWVEALAAQITAGETSDLLAAEVSQVTA